MNYDEFVQAEKNIEANHSDFFTAGKKLNDYILIVYNMRTGYKRHEWIDEKGLPEEVKAEVLDLIKVLSEKPAEEAS